ncbi:hypothetical protein [Nonomuraea zeae]|uniref:Trypsin-like peptidase domain-containing protein n=1 Tax=Nonomuraea zeae TaxID=1642303 RepID=A0A5S4FKW1_9ACTN|nr:hypothetical protein [Nonomuraea zeae]TMR21239.1 hypothetical protein ETD85_51220 [Nonomuraea zeae]
MAGPEEWRRARPLVRQARDQLWQRFREDPNVVGIGFGPPTRGGEVQDTPSCIVHVVRKVPSSQLAPSRAVPGTLDIQGTTVETDVVESGVLYAYTFHQKERPAMGGISIGHPLITAGTLGCLVKDMRDGEKVAILSNNHVLAAENKAKAGDPIYQPGPLDMPISPDNRIATLTRYENLDFSGAYNRIDAAIAHLDDNCVVYDDIKGDMTRPTVAQPAVGLLFAGGPFQTILNPIGEVTSRLGIEMIHGPAARSVLTAEDVRPPGSPVQKTGRTTEYTTGRITAIDEIVTVRYTGGYATFDGQILTTPMSQGGDSGSVVCRGGSGGTFFSFICPFLATAEELTGVPFTQEWMSISYARDKYLATTLVGRWLIDALYLNESTAMVRSAEVKPQVPDSDRAFAQALYSQHGGDMKLALMNPDRDDIRVSEQFIHDAEESLARARKFMLPDEAAAAEQTIALVRERGIVGMTGRDLLNLLDDPNLLQKLKEIAAGTGSLLDPDG